MSIYVRVRRPVPGGEPESMHGKLLARNIEVPARRLNVTALSTFDSVNRTQTITEDQDMSDRLVALGGWAEKNVSRLERPEAVLVDLDNARAEAGSCRPRARRVQYIGVDA